MRLLNSKEIDEAVGGTNVATGWAPVNWQWLSTHLNFATISGPGAVLVSGALSGPIGIGGSLSLPHFAGSTFSPVGFDDC